MNTEINRQQLEDIQRARNNLAMHPNLRNLVLEDLETQRHLVEGIRKMPQATVISQVQYLEEILLPQVQSKKGIESEDYKFFRNLVDSLHWLLHITDYATRLDGRINRLRHQLAYYQELSCRLENELQQYTTMERFLTKEMIAKATNNTHD